MNTLLERGEGVNVLRETRWTARLPRVRRAV